MNRPYLGPDLMARACFLWDHRKWDTQMIADFLQVPEHVVWRSLAQRREEQARMRGIVRAAG